MRFFSDVESLSNAVADVFVGAAREAIAERGHFSVALSGGSTPRRTYELLSSSDYRDQVRWDAVHVYWGDERCVSPDDERSNEGMARASLLNHVPIDNENVHPIRCTGDPNLAATRYEETLRAEFGRSASLFDLMLLGMGADGHSLSLFPGSPALHEHLRWTAVVRKEGEDIDRVTLTLPAVELARRVLFLVAGPDKQEMLARVHTSIDLPAARVALAAREVEWLVA